jgi:hypothetical protein
MKHLFVRHIQTTEAYNEATPAERKEWFDELGKVAKENGLKLVFYGTPYGVPESLSMVLKSDKSLDHLAKFGVIWSEHLKKKGLKSYGVAATTITILAPE